jgi:hypothetical protein
MIIEQKGHFPFLERCRLFSCDITNIKCDCRGNDSNEMKTGGRLDMQRYCQANLNGHCAIFGSVRTDECDQTLVIICPAQTYARIRTQAPSPRPRSHRSIINGLSRLRNYAVTSYRFGGFLRPDGMAAILTVQRIMKPPSKHINVTFIESMPPARV